MDISARLEFAAPPAEVYTMLTDKAYLEEVCVASQSVTYDVSVEGNVSHTSRTLRAPENVARFTGENLTVNDETTWGAGQADGSRTADVRLTILGQPVNLKAIMRLTPGGKGSVVELSGQLRVAIPLLGRKLEQSAAPAVLAGYRTQQQVGDRWLAR
jgi:uncharacterized protein YndB with AHSA1/START domain